MRMPWGIIWLACWLACGAPGVAERLDATRWLCHAEITVPGWTGTGLAAVEASAEIFDLLNGDLTNLRVTTTNDEIVPALFHIGASSPRRELPLAQAGLRRTLPGVGASIIVSCASPAKNRLCIDSDGANFRRHVRVEGCNDGRKWQPVPSSGLLYRITRDEGTVVDQQTVTLAKGGFRYLRVTVLRGWGDPPEITIKSVAVLCDRPTAPETVPVPILTQTRILADTQKYHLAANQQAQPRARDAHDSAIELDVGARNLPLSDLTLTVNAPEFLRLVDIYGRDRLRNVEVTPDFAGGIQQQIVDVPWIKFGQGAIYRVSDGVASAESLTLDLSMLQTRYVRLVFHDGDDGPLNLRVTGVHRRRGYLYFAPPPGQPLRLYWGSGELVAPRNALVYDFTRLRAHGLTPGRLGPASFNTDLAPYVDFYPWNDRYHQLIWAVFLLVGAVLIRLVWRKESTPASAKETVT